MHACLHACENVCIYPQTYIYYQLSSTACTVYLLEAHVGVCNVYSQQHLWMMAKSVILTYERAALSNQEYFISHKYISYVFEKCFCL